MFQLIAQETPGTARSGAIGDQIMRAPGRSFGRSRFAAFLTFAMLAGPVAILRGQEPTTNPTAEQRTTAQEPFSPTQSPEDVKGELQTVVPETGALFDVGIEDLFPQGFKDWRAEMKERYGFDFGFACTALY